MDYTLANYYRQPMEQLQYQLTVEYLVKNKGYPAGIRQLAYDPDLIIRGLVVSKITDVVTCINFHFAFLAGRSSA